MKIWLLRFHPRSWVQHSREEVEGDRRYGLRGRLLYVLLALFALSTLTLVVEVVLYGGTEMYQRGAQNNIIIFITSLAIAVGIFTKSWWTRYLAYAMFFITLSNLFLYGQVAAEAAPGREPDTIYFWTMLGLLLLRDAPLCLYLTASRRARVTLEHQRFRFDPDRPAKTGPA